MEVSTETSVNYNSCNTPQKCVIYERWQVWKMVPDQFLNEAIKGILLQQDVIKQQGTTLLCNTPV